jgi:hypothetical protein
MRDLRSIKMERGITDSKLPPRYNPDFVFPDKLSPYHQVLNFTGSEMMVGGAAGTAKTHHCVLKAHKLACMYPGSVGVFVRKVKESIKRTIVPTYYDVLGYNPMTNPGFVKGFGNTQPTEFHYQNGSLIFPVGLNDPKQLDSLQTDWFYVNQAEELDEGDWEILTTRNRGIKMDFRITFGDCNPSFPEHFLCPYDDNDNRRKEIVYVPTQHTDNPLFYRQGEWTDFGIEYVHGTLQRLTGLNYDRYYLSKWVFGEGAVFESFDRKKHISDKQWRKGDFGSEWKWYRGIDYGSTAPKVCQLWAVKDREEYRLVSEIYKTQLEAGDFYDMLMSMTADWVDLSKPKWTSADHDGEATLVLEKKEKSEKKGLRLRKVKKYERLLGRIELQKQYYADDKIMYNKNTLWHDKDENLIEKGAPWTTPMEIARYAYPEKKVGRRDDVPVKEHDHGIDAQGYVLDEENDYRGAIPRPSLKSVKISQSEGLFTSGIR